MSLIEIWEKFFADAGFPCPTTRNPSDHFLMCINLDFDLIAEALERTQFCLVYALDIGAFVFHFFFSFYSNDNAFACEF